MSPATDRPSPGAFRFSSRLERRIVRRVGQAVGDHRLIEQGDHLLVAVSGGKDSLSMLEALRLLRRRSPVSFRMTVVTLHQGYDAFSTDALEAFYQQRDLPYEIIHAPIREILESRLEPGTTPCALCSRIRRGVLYSHAPRLGCNKIALGHHLDDIAETLLMNLFYSGQLRAMAPLRRSDDGRNTVIRPLCYVEEQWLASYARRRGFPVTVCATEGCGSTDGARVRTKQLIQKLDRQIHGLRGNLLRALRNVRPEDLMDQRLARLATGRAD
jgi:tRNA 2-thiocytidine biosynthesis protein TtcA